MKVFEAMGYLSNHPAGADLLVAVPGVDSVHIEALDVTDSEQVLLLTDAGTLESVGAGNEPRGKTDELDDWLSPKEAESLAQRHTTALEIYKTRLDAAMLLLGELREACPSRAVFKDDEPRDRYSQALLEAGVALEEHAEHRERETYTILFTDLSRVEAQAVMGATSKLNLRRVLIAPVEGTSDES